LRQFFDIRLRDGFNLRPLTGTGFIYATLTAPTGRIISSLRVNSLSKEELEKLYKWIEKTVPIPRKGEIEVAKTGLSAIANR
jgi:hypothetical protein